MARDMMLTPDEYMAVMRLISSERESEGAKEEAKVANKPKRRSRTSRAQDKKLSNAFEEANRRLRTKAPKGSKNKYGPLRKGKTQGDVATLAHKLRKKM